MKNFEKHVHDHFDGREINVDKNELWANIAPQLEPAPKDKKRSWIFFFLGLTAGVALLGLYLFTQLEEKATASSILNQNEGSITNEEPTANPVASSTPIPPTETKSTAPKIVATPNNSTTTQTTRNTTTLQNKNDNNNSTNTIEALEPSEPFSQTSILTTNTNNINSSAITLQKEDTKIPLENNLLQISTLPISKFANAEIDFDNLPSIIRNEDDLITPSKSKTRFGLGFHAGVSKTQSVLRESSQDEFIYTQFRAATEDQLHTLHLGLSGVVAFKRNIYLQLGLEYSQINSRLNLGDEHISIDTAQSLIIRHGNFIDTTGVPDQYVVKEFSKNNTRNTFHLLDLPILFGYQFGKARWRAGIEAGAFINIRLRKEGEVLQEDLSLYDIGEDTDKWYKTNVGIRPHLGLVSTYDLSAHYQLYFSTGITFNKIFSTNNSPISMEKSMFGMRIGGRYYF